MPMYDMVMIIMISCMIDMIRIGSEAWIEIPVVEWGGDSRFDTA